MTKKFLLKYSTERADKPILASVIRKTDVPINILRADLTPEGGEILVAIDAPDEKVKKIEELFKVQGLEVEEIKRVIQLDEESCIDCGACVSLCPTEALRLTEDYSLELDEDKCVYCEACVPACPMRALSVRKL
ncbi:MAG: 4Fe-4S binding protein [Candidatus Hadarchaeota archaeon]|nr:4Fe-4S binding protein [Candidatus Hadarchaeota archaeon]